MKPNHRGSLPWFFADQSGCVLNSAWCSKRKAIDHDVQESGDSWILTVAPALAHRPTRKSAAIPRNAALPRRLPVLLSRIAGAAIGAVGYVLILLLTAYCAGTGLFGADWLSLGALGAGLGANGGGQLTALTLHVDQEHLLGNLLFGVVAGIAAGRLLGPGVAWASILAAGTLANYRGNAHCTAHPSRGGRLHGGVRGPGNGRRFGVAAAAHAARAPLVRFGAADRGRSVC